MENGWQEWSKFVLKELERLNKLQENMFKEINRISEEIAILKIKSGIWGAIGGAIPVLIVLIIKLVSDAK